jgi:hypothetical protein
VGFKKFIQNKWVKIPYLIIVHGFAGYGFFLLAVYFAMKLNLTNETGAIDPNNRYFQEMHDKYNQNFKIDSVTIMKNRYEVLNRIILLNDFFPQNAETIRKIYESTKDEELALKMLDAVDLHLANNETYQKEKAKVLERSHKTSALNGLSAFEWMNVTEWKYFKQALLKDKKWIDSAAKASGVEARIIVCCLVGEQVRMFNSRREKFKTLVAPLKSLVLETNQSYGVTGIKDFTAKRIEENLKNSSSSYYLGPEFEHLLDYDSSEVLALNKHNDTLSVRLQRLVQYQNHYYSYLYAGLFVRQIKVQWEKAGFPIDDRPEILASLFNLGYQKSKPKKDPAVGGSNFKINDTEHTFGSVAFDFYYSGELANEFPYSKEKFIAPAAKPIKNIPVKKTSATPKSDTTRSKAN